MKLKFTILFLLIGMILPSKLSALKWHDDMVTYLMNHSAVEKTIVVERHPLTGQIINARYNFIFSSSQPGVARYIKQVLIDQTNTATLVSISENDSGRILLETVEQPNSVLYTYKFIKDGTKGKYQLLIEVKKNGKSSWNKESSVNTEDDRSFIDMYEDFKALHQSELGQWEIDDGVKIIYLKEKTKMK